MDLIIPEEDSGDALAQWMCAEYLQSPTGKQFIETYPLDYRADGISPEAFKCLSEIFAQYGVGPDVLCLIQTVGEE